MSLFRRIAQLDQKFSWSFLGFLLAIILGGLTIYTQFIKKNSPDLNFEVISNANVLDVHESIGNLDILYKGSSLSRNNQALRIVVLRIVNDGDQAILPSYYDPDDPVGFRVLGGQIVERPRILGAGSSYLLGHAKISQGPSGEVIFSKVILEPGDFFTIKVLLLHSNAEEPRVIPIGKVAGIKKISLTRRDKDDDQSPRWQLILSGPLWVQAVRAVSYSAGTLGFIVVVLAAAVSVSESFSRRSRRKVVEAFKEYAEPKLTSADELFFDIFLDEGRFTLMELYDLLGDEVRLKRALRPRLRARHGELELDRHTPRDYDRRLFRQLVDYGVVLRSDSGIEVNAARKEVLGEFIAYLRKRGFIQDASSKLAEA